MTGTTSKRPRSPVLSNNKPSFRKNAKVKRDCRSAAIIPDYCNLYELDEFLNHYAVIYTPEIMLKALCYFTALGLPTNLAPKCFKSTTINSHFCIMDAGHRGEMFMKIATDYNFDSLDGDVAVSMMLQKALRNPAYSRYAKHFTQFEDAFPLLLSLKDESREPYCLTYAYYLNHDDPIQPSYFNIQQPPHHPDDIHMPFPCYVTKAISQPERFVDILVAVKCNEYDRLIPIFGDLDNDKDAYVEAFWPMFGEFVHAMLRVGVKFGFTHNDLHLGNIVWDPVKRCFVCFDYGRSWINLDDIELLRRSMYKLMCRVARNNQLFATPYAQYRNKRIMIGEDDIRKFSRSKRQIPLLTDPGLFFQNVCPNVFRLHMGNEGIFNDLAAICMNVYVALRNKIKEMNHVKDILELVDAGSNSTMQFIIPNNKQDIYRNADFCLHCDEPALNILSVGVSWFALILLHHPRVIKTPLQNGRRQVSFQQIVADKLVAPTSVALPRLLQIPNLEDLCEEYLNHISTSPVFTRGTWSARGGQSTARKGGDNTGTRAKTTEQAYAEILRTSHLLRVHDKPVEPRPGDDRIWARINKLFDVKVSSQAPSEKRTQAIANQLPLSPWITTKAGAKKSHIKNKKKSKR